MGGGRATLANGWTLRRSTVAGEPRIELTGPNYTHDAELTHAGIFTERIGYTTRYFIPTGEGAARALESVLERRPIVDIERSTTSSGLAEERPAFAEQGEGRGTGPAEFRDLRDDFNSFHSGMGAEDSHQAACDWVSQKGLETGHEHLAVYDPAGGRVAYAGTGDSPNRLPLFPELIDRLADPNQALVVHHNHPRGFAPSASDVALLAEPGAHSVVVHTQQGDVFGPA